MIIAGPCQHESLEQSLQIIRVCYPICKIHNVPYVFKASFDKANRSKKDSPRGLGIRRTNIDFNIIKEEFPELQILTDIHEPWQAEQLPSVDIFQIPALLSRQTDLIVAAAESGKIVNLKKGQFMSPYDTPDMVEKAKGAKEVWVTERGTSFGYNRLVVDFVGLDYMLNNLDAKIVFDVTHSIQNPGKVDTSPRKSIIPLAKAGKGLGVENFFFEVHPNPEEALSDGPNSLRLSDFKKLVTQIKSI